MRLKSLLKRHGSDAASIPDELQACRQFLMDFYRFPTDPVRAPDIRMVVKAFEPFEGLDCHVWQQFITEYDNSVVVGLYNMLVNISVPLDDVESEELMHTYLEWISTVTKLLPAESYQSITISARLLSTFSIILKAYPNERIAISLLNTLELIARNYRGDRIDATMNKTALQSCLRRVLDCFDSIYFRDSHVLIKFTVLISNLIVNGTILELLASCPNLDRFRDLFCRYWNLGNAVEFYIPVINTIFETSDSLFTNDDARIIVNTLLNTLESSQDARLNDLLIGCLKTISSSSKFRELGEMTAKRALFIVNNLVAWTDSDPPSSSSATSLRSQRRASLPLVTDSSSSPSDGAISPEHHVQRRASLQTIQFQLACIADS